MNERDFEDAVLRAQVAELEERRFPVLDAGFSVPWRLVAPFEAQAERNHNQTLQRLAERGGLDPVELWAVMHGMGWKDRSKLPSQEAAKEWALSLVSIEARAEKAEAELSKSEWRVAELEDDVADARILLEPHFGQETYQLPLAKTTADLIARAEKAEARVAELEADRDEWFRGYHEMTGLLKAAEARVEDLEAYAKLADVDAASEENLASGLEARIAELDDELKGLVQENTRLENSLRNWREGAERVEKERAFWRTRGHELEAKLRETQDELAHEKGGRLDEAAIRSAVEKETGMWPYGRIADAVAECLRSQQAKWEAFVSVEAERAEKAEARVKELEAQAETDDKRAVEVNDAHLKQVATLRARIAELEAYSKLADLDAESEERRADALEVELARGMEACRAHVCLGAQEARAERDEAVAALRALLREEWYTYEGNLEAAGHASVDDLNAARAVLAKYPEGR